MKRALLVLFLFLAVPAPGQMVEPDDLTDLLIVEQERAAREQEGDGSAEIVMPDLRGQTLEEAGGRLRALNFSGEPEVVEVPSEGRTGLVVGQNPVAGKPLRPPVSLFVTTEIASADRRESPEPKTSSLPGVLSASVPWVLFLAGQILLLLGWLFASRWIQGQADREPGRQGGVALLSRKGHVG